MPKRHIPTDFVIESLASLGLTLHEIATITKTSPSELRSRKGDVIELGKARLCKSIRRAQVKSALRGNANMLVWLGKQLLNQSDKVDSTIHSTNTHVVITPDLQARLQSVHRSTLKDASTRVIDLVPEDLTDKPLPHRTTPTTRKPLPRSIHTRSLLEEGF